MTGPPPDQTRLQYLHDVRVAAAHAASAHEMWEHYRADCEALAVAAWNAGCRRADITEALGYHRSSGTVLHRILQRHGLPTSRPRPTTGDER